MGYEEAEKNTQENSLLPKIRYAKFDIPKDSKLQKYTDELVNIIKNSKGNEALINFRDQLFYDSFAFVRNELKTEKYPKITVDFVPTQAEYEMLEKRLSLYANQREKSTISTRGFVITNPYGNKIYINFETHLSLITVEKNISAFIFNLVSTLIHEILHCFFSDLKNEQEIYDLQCNFLETFLGVILPTEMKNAKASDFYNE